jgi:hypothetical protein
MRGSPWYGALIVAAPDSGSIPVICPWFSIPIGAQVVVGTTPPAPVASHATSRAAVEEAREF